MARPRFPLEKNEPKAQERVEAKLPAGQRRRVEQQEALGAAYRGGGGEKGKRK